MGGTASGARADVSAEKMVAGDMSATVPVIYLLSVGADPTDAIKNLARKMKQTVATVSMGEGQEPFALQAPAGWGREWYVGFAAKL